VEDDLGFVSVRLTVDGIKHEIIRALTLYEKNLQKDIEGAVKKAIDNFDFEKELACQVDIAIKEAIARAVQNALIWGDGYKKIEKIVREAIDKKAKFTDGKEGKVN